MESRCGFVVGAPHSGSGKTTVTLGLLHALRHRLGLSVQPFKCGPDFVDPQFQGKVAGCPSVNLDLFLQGEMRLKRAFSHYAAGHDVAVVEGVMGLFDGYSRDQGSAAHLARILDLPVILVVDARAMGHSAAALLHGFRTYSPSTRIVGVIFNRVSSEAHYGFLREAAAEVGVESLGYLPRREENAFTERYLGLDAGDAEHFSHAVESISQGLREHVDLQRLLAITQRRDGGLDGLAQDGYPAASLMGSGGRARRIAVARDEAFSFLYAENLDSLNLWGEVRFFSPVQGDGIPEGCDFVYLPGGYPELYLEQLQDGGFLRSLKEWVDHGGALLAEGGGLMALSRSVETQQGQRMMMAGVLPLDLTLRQGGLQMGYREIEIGGRVLRGHEFHYSRIESQGMEPLNIPCRNARGKPVVTAFFRVKNCFAGYMHFLWNGTPPWELFLSSDNAQ